ncbi:hypothetical protein BX661DRAFT_198922 [Kickxella alabastrina]|uniref:uncharacterized protein n=1 Tax=Kickxella alabastrina TaxID=61397 RepID=UPI00221FAA7B|nr:uncharacterized protein BX661DRAFT_198922 [Kickxella alabastrina]KAI7826318.1 hypothetical protein BX661DRAFT_198922 [Kickxella alabastrina]
MTIFYSANDAAAKASRQHVSLDVFSETLKYTVFLVNDPKSEYYLPETRILLITPPALGDCMYTKYMGETSKLGMRNNNNTRLYADAVKNFAKYLRLSCVGMWTVVEDKMCGLVNTDPFDGYDEYLVNGLHFSAKGNQLLYDLVVKDIELPWPE